MCFGQSVAPQPVHSARVRGSTSARQPRASQMSGVALGSKARAAGDGLARVNAAAAVAASVAAVTVHLLTPLAGSAWTGSLLILTVAGLIGAATHVAAAWLLRLTELGQLAATTIAVVRAS
jgi:hypothetical protein